MNNIPQDEPEIVGTREGYDAWAGLYDGEDNALVALEERHFAQLLGPVDGLDVVDLGCGTGRVSLRMASAGAHVTAVDFSAGMLAVGRSKPGAERVQFVEHDLSTALPFASAAFDRVVCCLVLDHVRDLKGLFAEMRRIVRPDGRAVLTAMHPAMMLRGVQARFRDPSSGREIRPESQPNQISDYVLAAAMTGWAFEEMIERQVDEGLAAVSPRAVKHMGWMLLLGMRLKPV